MTRSEGSDPADIENMNLGDADNVVQAGVVHGDIHVHLRQSPAPGDAPTAGARGPDAALYRIGQGVPSWTRRFQELCAALAGRITLGAPDGEAYWEGPGGVQYFDGGDGELAWVLCGLPNHEPVMVAVPVWDALSQAGSDSFAAVGLPAMGREVPLTDRLIGPEATRVELEQGTWGRGLLVRDEALLGWRWEARCSFRSEITPAGRYWTGESGTSLPRLRLRAVATLPWAVEDVAISAETRRRLRQELPYGEFAGAVTALSRRRGGELLAAPWRENESRPQSREQAGFLSSIAAPDGEPAQATEEMMSLPNAMNSSVVTCAELRVQDLAAWREALTAAGGPPLDGADLRLSVGELSFLFAAAWQPASETLPDALIGEPAIVPLAGPPLVELRLTAENAHDAPMNTRRQLRDLVDFRAFGESGRDPLDAMSVTVSAPTRLRDDERYGLTRGALVHMAQTYGFIDASEDSL